MVAQELMKSEQVFVGALKLLNVVSVVYTLFLTYHIFAHLLFLAHIPCLLLT